MNRKVNLIRTIIITLAFVCFIGTTHPLNAEAAKKPKLNKTSISLQQGKTATIKVKGVSKKTKKYTWKVTGKAVKIVSSKKNTVKVKAVKDGKSFVKIKVNGKTLKCAVKVAKEAKKPATGKPAVTQPEKPEQPKFGQEVTEPVTEPGVTEPGVTQPVNPEHGNSGEQNEKDIAFRYRRGLGSNGIYFYDNFTTFIPAFLNLKLSDEEARAWTEALSPSEKAFLIETINASDNSDGLKKDMIAIVENPTLLTEEEGIREELSRRENDEGYKHVYGLALSALPGNNGLFDVDYEGNCYQLRESDYRKIVDSRGRVILPEPEFLALMEKLAEEYGRPVDLGR